MKNGLQTIVFLRLLWILVLQKFQKFERTTSTLKTRAFSNFSSNIINKIVQKLVLDIYDRKLFIEMVLKNEVADLPYDCFTL